MTTKGQVRFTYNKQEGYRQVYVNGVYGGPTPKGEVECHFYFEHPVLPKERLFDLTKRSTLGKEITEKRDIVEIDRDLVIGFVMRPEDAESIANFLLQKAKILSERK
ncbi:MAG TPA: hypothetical protein VMS95_02905 [Candidatus Krumholzibacteriaceae bacterium]|nr:hypothetical protein [Candidatus Krumholzibacteriaceae bacterium]